MHSATILLPESLPEPPAARSHSKTRSETAAQAAGNHPGLPWQGPGTRSWVTLPHALCRPRHLQRLPCSLRTGPQPSPHSLSSSSPSLSAWCPEILSCSTACFPAPLGPQAQPELDKRGPGSCSGSARVAQSRCHPGGSCLRLIATPAHQRVEGLR